MELLFCAEDLLQAEILGIQSEMDTKRTNHVLFVLVKVAIRSSDSTCHSDEHSGLVRTRSTLVDVRECRFAANAGIEIVLIRDLVEDLDDLIGVKHLESFMSLHEANHLLLFLRGYNPVGKRNHRTGSSNRLHETTVAKPRDLVEKIVLLRIDQINERHDDSVRKEGRKEGKDVIGATSDNGVVS